MTMQPLCIAISLNKIVDEEKKDANATIGLSKKNLTKEEAWFRQKSFTSIAQFPFQKLRISLKIKDLFKIREYGINS